MGNGTVHRCRWWLVRPTTLIRFASPIMTASTNSSSATAPAKILQARKHDLQADVVIIGAGLAGLACSRRLWEQGIPNVILEKDQNIGGRVQTDEVDGFLLDRGFQVLQTAYPMAHALFDMDALALQPFHNGALVKLAGGFDRIMDPLRHPGYFVETMRSGVGTLADKFRLLKLRTALRGASIEELFEKDETTTYAALRTTYGFSTEMIDRFFRPFLGGITFDADLETSSRVFEFVMRMFSSGPSALPKKGMGAIASATAKGIPTDAICCGITAHQVRPSEIQFSDGNTVQCKHVVVATEGPNAYALTGAFWGPLSRSVTTLYYAAPAPPLQEPILMLEGRQGRLINNVAVLSAVSDAYAPDDQALISVTVLGNPSHTDEALDAAVRGELTDWFGSSATHYRHLRTYRIWHGLPDQPVGTFNPPQRPVSFGEGLYICGDHRDQASIQGALSSGLRTAGAVMAAIA